ncbi:hypothetical protein MUCCIDRAFT_79183 [Mucor lusitanicus CBS 277.49]|uniref:DDE Tnp4 domain-containing protein n=1 Tax=Mucor lusitanicus CBS 277.49 TaxID=747725 RepID=A0A168N3N0_MUCCL|nr:hypothetical protein MUCCIDRAFT_79183 [Mucor lusitanicus CBS 277.49]
MPACCCRYSFPRHYGYKRKFAAAVDQAGALISNVIGFIDGTLQQVNRPSTDDAMQKALYNGWKHLHAIQYQAIVTPDGITSSIMGPVIGSTHDRVSFSMLETERRLERYLDLPENEEDQFVLYGDPAYISASPHVYTPFPSNTTDPIERECNRSMSKVRIAVEWEFGEVMKHFTYAKYRYGMKTGGNNPAKIYILSTVFKKMLHCCRQGVCVRQGLFER